MAKSWGFSVTVWQNLGDIQLLYGKILGIFSYCMAQTPTHKGIWKTRVHWSAAKMIPLATFLSDSKLLRFVSILKGTLELRRTAPWPNLTWPTEMVAPNIPAILPLLRLVRGVLIYHLCNRKLVLPGEVTRINTLPGSHGGPQWQHCQ